MTRAYVRLRASQQLARFRRLRGALVNGEIAGVAVGASPFFFGAAIADAELVTRQYALVRLAGNWFDRALLGSLAAGGRVVHPLPRAWQDTLVRHGFPVARRRCTIAWAAFVALLWAYGVVTMAKHLSDSVRHAFVRPSLPRGFAFFHQLTRGNLPQPGSDGRSHDVVTWYAQWPGRLPGVERLCHTVGNVPATTVRGLSVETVAHAVPPVEGVRAIAALAGWSAAAVVRSAFDAVRGRWWHAFLLAEAATAARARLAPRDRLAADCLFHVSGHIYRALWTYEAARLGSRVLFYFYSLSEQFKLPEGYDDDRDEWGAMNWPHYLAMDQYQADLVRRAVGDAPRIDVVGPIWFQTSAAEMPELPGPAIAVFDIEPHRRSQHFGHSTRNDLYPSFARVANQFLADIHDAVRAHGGVVAHKRKRNRTRRSVHPAYAAFLRRFEASPTVVPIDPDLAPVKVIECCAAVISAPYTTTALFARAQGKPSAFYDPIGVLARDDRGAHGIPVLSGPDELRAWVADVFAEVESASNSPVGGTRH